MQQNVEDTFTYHVFAFLRKPSILFFKRNACMLGLPPPQDRTALFDPLQRVRAIVRNIFAGISAALPSNSWQWTLSHFALPCQWGGMHKPSAVPHDLRDEFASAKTDLLNFFRQGGHNTPEETFSQVRRLILVAEKFHKQGVSPRLAWAMAFQDFAELCHARDAISMLLAALHSTGNVERALKDVALQYTPERASLVGGTVNDLVIVDIHAPKVEDIASKADIPGSTSKICPKGDYMDKILNAYRKIFGGRPWSRKPKIRRDKNISRKKQAATTSTEAHFCRQREEAVAGLVAAMEGKPPGVIQSF